MRRTKDSHLSLGSVPLGCGGYVALDNNGSSGCKPPLQSPIKWHRLWEENMVSHRLSGPQKPEAGTNFQRGALTCPGKCPKPPTSTPSDHQLHPLPTPLPPQTPSAHSISYLLRALHGSGPPTHHQFLLPHKLPHHRTLNSHQRPYRVEGWGSLHGL